MSQAERRSTFAVLLAMSLLGMVTGFLTGVSRALVIGTVLPAVLSLIAGLLLVLVGREANSDERRLIGTCCTALTLNLLMGTLWGAVSRENPRSMVINAENEENASASQLQ